MPKNVPARAAARTPAPAPAAGLAPALERVFDLAEATGRTFTKAQREEARQIVALLEATILATPATPEALAEAKVPKAALAAAAEESRARWTRVGKAAEAIRPTKSERLAAAVDAVEVLAGVRAKVGAAADAAHVAGQAAKVLSGLAKVDLAAAGEALAEAAKEAPDRAGRRKGGRGKRGPVAIVAKLVREELETVHAARAKAKQAKPRRSRAKV